MRICIPSDLVFFRGGLISFYSISYMWYSMIGAILVIVIGLIISFLTTPQDPEELDPEMISPPVNAFVKYMFPEFRHRVGWDLGAKKKVSPLRLSLPPFSFLRINSCQ